jgi:hypothetical protein
MTSYFLIAHTWSIWWLTCVRDHRPGRTLSPRTNRTKVLSYMPAWREERANGLRCTLEGRESALYIVGGVVKPWDREQLPPTSLAAIAPKGIGGVGLAGPTTHLNPRRMAPNTAVGYCISPFFTLPCQITVGTHASNGRGLSPRASAWSHQRSTSGPTHVS